MSFIAAIAAINTSLLNHLLPSIPPFQFTAHEMPKTPTAHANSSITINRTRADITLVASVPAHETSSAHLTGREGSALRALPPFVTRESAVEANDGHWTTDAIPVVQATERARLTFRRVRTSCRYVANLAAIVTLGRNILRPITSAVAPTTSSDALARCTTTVIDDINANFSPLKIAAIGSFYSCFGGTITTTLTIAGKESYVTPAAIVTGSPLYDSIYDGLGWLVRKK